jgi:SRSO17 transposase
VAFIDNCCARGLATCSGTCGTVRSTLPCIWALHLGLLAETRRKILPRQHKMVHTDPQALHHFLANAEWSVEALRQDGAPPSSRTAMSQREST